MNFAQIVLVTLLSEVVSAHFRVPFPGERNATNWDTQTESPCGGDNKAVLPRYEWNPNGSPIEINYHHTFGVGAMYFCGSGNCTTGSDFNELIYEPIDQQKGNFCLPSVEIPSKYNKINQTGVIQIIYAANSKDGKGYEYMYNCVDVIVSENGPIFNGQCSNSTQGSFDEGVAKLEKVATKQLDSFSVLTYLDAHKDSASAIGSKSVTTTSSMDMDMGGMDMSGMTMSTTSSSSSMDMDMGGMTMSTTSSLSSSMDMGNMSMDNTISSTSNSGSITSTSRVSSAGANSLTLSFSKFILIALSLL